MTPRVLKVLCIFQLDSIFHMGQGWVEINQIVFQVHLYFNDRRRSEEVSSFLRKILALETAAQKQVFQNKEQAMEYLAGHLKGTTPFFQVKSNDGQLRVTPNTKALSQRMATMGAFLM